MRNPVPIVRPIFSSSVRIRRKFSSFFFYEDLTEIPFLFNKDPTEIGSFFYQGTTEISLYLTNGIFAIDTVACSSRRQIVPSMSVLSLVMIHCSTIGSIAHWNTSPLVPCNISYFTVNLHLYTELPPQEGTTLRKYHFVYHYCHSVVWEGRWDSGWEIRGACNCWTPWGIYWSKIPQVGYSADLENEISNWTLIFLYSMPSQVIIY